ncbi:MAG: PAS domain-containing protein, partial [Salinivirgaceae bacterium]
QYLELLASVGFDKEKMAHKTIMPNEGNVGRCLLEKLRIYMDDIPKNYPPVLSGLGQTKPGSALVVPMLINEVVVGIIEIGSLRRLQEFEIEFVEKIAVSIASTISSAKVNARTAELLEKSKEQADELSQQEEEMRQNMEELQAMQEEATKRELQIENFIKAAKSTLLFVEYDMDANITDINNNMLNLFQLKRDQVVGKKTGYYEFNSADKKDDQELIWDNLRQGKSAVNVSHSKYSGKEIYLKEYYYPLRNENGKVYKVVNIAFDITEEKRKEDQLAKLKKEYEQLQRNKQTQAPAPAKPEVNINDVLDDENYFEYVDLTHLRKVYKNDLRKIQNIISIYVDTIPKQIRELIEVSKRDMGQLKSKINNFKTKMSYLGLMQIVDMAKEVEAACNNNGETSEVTDFLDEIMDVWEEAEKELRSIIVK